MASAWFEDGRLQRDSLLKLFLSQCHCPNSKIQMFNGTHRPLHDVIRIAQHPGHYKGTKRMPHKVRILQAPNLGFMKVIKWFCPVCTVNINISVTFHDMSKLSKLEFLVWKNPPVACSRCSQPPGWDRSRWDHRTAGQISPPWRPARHLKTAWKCLLYPPGRWGAPALESTRLQNIHGRQTKMTSRRYYNLLRVQRAPVPVFGSTAAKRSGTSGCNTFLAACTTQTYKNDDVAFKHLVFEKIGCQVQYKC